MSKQRQRSRKAPRETVDETAGRKRAEGPLRESEERLRILFEFAPDAYYLNDLEGNFVDGNRAAEEVSGHPGTVAAGGDLRGAWGPPGSRPRRTGSASTSWCMVVSAAPSPTARHVSSAHSARSQPSRSMHCVRDARSLESSHVSRALMASPALGEAPLLARKYSISFVSAERIVIGTWSML